MLKFNKTYFCITVAIFIIEVLIAMLVHDRIIRPYIGDVLVVILIYSFIKSFVEIKILNASVFVLFFAFLIEGLQYLKIVERIGLEHNKIVRVIIGASFEWMDIICYIVGMGIVLLAEKSISKR